MNANAAFDGSGNIAPYADDVEASTYADDVEASTFDFSLRHIWAATYRNRFILLVSIAICLVLSIVYLLLATPVYQAQASVKIEEQSTRILKADETEQSRNPIDAARFLQTQLDVIRSRSVAMAVARDQHLFGNTQFLKAMRAPLTLKPSNILTPRQAQEEQVLAILHDNMSVSLPPDSRIATISFRSPDPRLAARIADSFAESYIRTDLQRRYDASAYARQFIAGQLADAKQQLERSERAAIDYSSSQRLIDASNGTENKNGTSSPKSLTVSRLVATNSAYADAVAKRTDAEQKWRQAQGASIMSLPEVLSNTAIQTLVQKRAEAAADYQTQIQIRKADYPSVLQARAQVAAFDRQIATLAGNIRASLQAQYEAALRQEKAFGGQIAGLEQATLGEQQRNVQLSILRRATDTGRSLYDTLLQRYRELNAEAGIQPNNIQLIDRAELPTVPVSPRLMLTLLIGLLSGMVIGVAAAFAKEHLNDTVRSGPEISRQLNLPFLGAVPQSSSPMREVLLDRKSAASEAYSSIRTALLMASQTGLPRVLAFTSIEAGEGKTTSSFATATGLSRIGKRVVVIDCDLRRPSLHKVFGIENRRGMSNYLAGQVTLDQILQSAEENISVITCGDIPPDPTELLSGHAFPQLLMSLREAFDSVIIDAPPILGLADAVIIGSNADGIILVMESGRNYRGGSRLAVTRLRRVGSHIIGAILTKQNLRDSGYAYSQDYQYRYGDGT
jgi:succinoglycan biosynthesis transport protein ExoP